MTKNVLASFSVGFIFSLGLAISGMTHPEKVIGFLNILKNWDPSLIFVMGAAIPIHILAYQYIKNKSHPLFDSKWHYPTSKVITKNLVIGSLIFGMGWGIAGLCPGPALASVTSGSVEMYVFIGFMTLGMYIEKSVSQFLK
ncbi:MAG TPA: YeeE/YedE thiosulfate transporter family protein [Pseudobdellovibrionaceae bacterium]|nr:YeeE/YedE thiosulfate transporter family protein [Pseudobdellovibrionaceae bacterium]